ncbi:S1C family serine protease [Xylanibacillus composti]|uniref:Serine protease n=1 Tax=Xylanibacillus composti TaxID=1572762 RepID=A0A8J4H4M9_9BACL|nr:serine protease [Xylanibacillus composti]GIQ69550.1 hypothetical protein XYCOK13_23740 [Xylanibacillus composti]
MSDHDKNSSNASDSIPADSHLDEENGREFTEEELEEMFKAAEEEEMPEPFWHSPRFRKIVVGVMVFAFCAQLLAFLPRIYSLAAIQFLATSAALSQMESIQQYKEAVVVIQSEDSKGTGFMISEDGLVVTNRHVIDKDTRPFVHLPGGGSYMATVVAIDQDVDLALLRIDAEDLPFLPLAENYGGEAGKPIYVIGNPLFFTNIANEGETLGLTYDGRAHLMVLDAPIYKGNSGSPVIAHDGVVIGVVFATSSMEQDGKKRRIGLAVPVDWVWRLQEGAS